MSTFNLLIIAEYLQLRGAVEDSMWLVKFRSDDWLCNG